MSKITSRREDYSRWYTDVIAHAELADYSPVKGCMVIRPHGYAIWEHIQSTLDAMIKATGHSNAYFPLFIPRSFLEKEARHVKGFAPECAVVTHGGGKELEEPLIVRPTSETIINAMFSKWVGSHRDLPLLINQWANVVRWEMRTRLFLRTTEFLWQEGHTAHATAAEAEEEARRMLGVYRDLVENTLAISPVTGLKSDTERFAGANRTYTVEAMMANRWALQCGTSHDLGQNFAKAFDIKFQDAGGQTQHVWQTSWGVSTRLIGALVMAHSDDDGLLLPPAVAPIQVVVIPIYKKEEEQRATVAAGRRVVETLKDTGLRVRLDDRDHLKPGAKYYEWEKKGVCLRLEIGPRDLEKDQAFGCRRDDRSKAPYPFAGIAVQVRETLDGMQAALLARSKAFREEHTHEAGSLDEFERVLGDEVGGGWLLAYWCGQAGCEAVVKERTGGATLRCIPDHVEHGKGKCAVCGNESERRAVWARAY